jgi:beta-1,4-mannosyltransferase
MPDYRKSNPYQSLLQSSLKDVGVTVSFDNFPAGFFPLWQACKRHPNISAIHIHWIVELIRHTVWLSNPIIFRLKCFLLVSDCYLLKLRGVKLVWTIHNKLAHEGFAPKRETYIRGRLAKAVSRIIVHSQKALDLVSDLYKVDIKNKNQVIFHGNYIGVYPCPSDSLQSLRDKKKLSSEAIVVSYVGMMRLYKSLELLINTFKNLHPNELLSCVKKLAYFVMRRPEGAYHVKEASHVLA